MRLLLDTHTALWAVSRSKKLPVETFDLVSSPDSEVYVSVVSLWEVGIKNTQGHRDHIPYPVTRVLAYFLEAKFQILSMRPEHSIVFEQVPVLHSDPFDRMLVAQAQHEGLKLLTRDAKLAQYGDAILSF